MTTITLYGGSDTSYAENHGATLGVVTSDCWADRAMTTRLTDLRDKDGNTVSQVTTADNGHYDFGVGAGGGGVVYLNFGVGAYAVQPRDLGDRLVVAEAALSAAQAAITALQAAPTAVTFASAVAWTPSTPYTAGQFRTEPDGSVRIVNTPYTSGTTYGAADTSNSAKVIDPYLTAAGGTALFAPLSLTAGEFVTYVGETLSDGYDPDPNGYELLTPITVTSLLGELDDVAIGGATQVMTYRFRPSGTGAGYLPVGLTTVPDSKVTPGAPLLLGANNHTATVTSGNAVVNDASITTALQGQPVTGTGIPANTYVGTVIASTSFRLSSSPTAQVDVLATAAGTSVQIAPTVACVAHDRIVDYLIDAVDPSTSTFPGAGLKIRIGVGSTTFTVPTAPSAPTSFVVATATSSSLQFTWALGTGSAMTEVWKNKNDGGGWKRVARLYNSTSWTDTDVTTTAATYKLLARVPGAVSAFTSTITAAPTTVWSLMPQATAGPWDTTKFSTTLGTNNTLGSPSATVDAASGGHQFAHLRSGATGSATTNDPQDRALVKATVDATARRAWGFRALMTPLNTATLLELYFGAYGTFSLTTGSTDFLRSTVTPNGVSLEGKAATYDPTGEGTTGTTTGQFQSFTRTDYQTNIVTGATRTASGTIAFPSAIAVGTYKGVKVVADLPSGGRQLVSFYYGDETQYGTDASGLPLMFTVNLTSRFVTARQAGQFYLQQLGKQTSPTAVEGWDFKDYVDITPIGA